MSKIVPWDTCLGLSEEEAKAKRAALESQRQPVGEDGPLGTAPSADGSAPLPIGGALVGADMALTYGDPLQLPQYAALGLVAGILGAIVGPEDCLAHQRVWVRLDNGEEIDTLIYRKPAPAFLAGKLSFDSAALSGEHAPNLQEGERIKVIKVAPMASNLREENRSFSVVLVKPEDCPRSRFCRGESRF